MTGLSIHDNVVLGYTVDVEAKTLILRTEYRDGSPSSAPTSTSKVCSAT